KSSCPHRKKSSPCALMPTCCDGSAASADTRPVSTPSCAPTWKRRSRTSFLKKPSKGKVRYAHPLQSAVQSHDILYTLSLDRLYTPARKGRREVEAGWHGRRWMFGNSGYGLW